MMSIFRIPLLCLLLSLPRAALLADDANASAKLEFAEFLEDARQYTMRLKPNDSLLKLSEQPLLNFTNPERNQERGSVFVWMNEDRPAVIGQIFRWDMKDGKRPKKHALHSLVQEPLEARLGDVIAWAPDKPGIEWKELTAPVAANRSLQLRQLSRQFRVTLTEPKTKLNAERETDLRLFPRPLFEYSSPKSGLIGGAIFSFVVATDPEAILLIEASEAPGQFPLRYAFARFHYWKITAYEGERVVWSVDRDERMQFNRIGHPEHKTKAYSSYIP